MLLRLLFIIFFLKPLLFYGQEKNDMELIMKGGTNSLNDTINNKKPMGTSAILVKINPLFYVARGAMFVYQHYISEQWAAECQFSRSCSNFSKGAIKEYGLLKGIFLSADRLTRCNANAGTMALPLNIDHQTGKVIDEPKSYSVK